MKTCSKCGLTKSLKDYHSDKHNKDGKRYSCKACCKLKKQIRKKITFICESCNESYEVDKYTIKRKKTNFCKKCHSKCVQGGIKRPQLSRENSPRWNGGEYIL